MGLILFADQSDPDTKPENILVRKDGQVKLADFGIATHRTADGRTADELARAGLISGTPQYIAPEQIRTPDQIDFRADMYCLGATLFHAATGHPPFACDTLDDLLNAHLSATPLPVSALIPGFDPQLAELIGRLLLKHPSERPSSFEELHLSFESVSDRILAQQSSHRQSVFSTQVSAIKHSDSPSVPPGESGGESLQDTQQFAPPTSVPSGLKQLAVAKSSPTSEFFARFSPQVQRVIGFTVVASVLLLLLLAIKLFR